MTQFFVTLEEFIRAHSPLLLALGFFCVLALLIWLLVAQTRAARRAQTQMDGFESELTESVDGARRAQTDEIELQYAELRTNLMESNESAVKVLNEMSQNVADGLRALATRVETMTGADGGAENVLADRVEALSRELHDCPRPVCGDTDGEVLARVEDIALATREAFASQIGDALKRVDGMFASLLCALDARFKAMDDSIANACRVAPQDAAEGSFRMAARRLEHVNESLEEMNRIAGDIASMRKSPSGVSLAELYALERRGQEIWSRIGEMQGTYRSFAEALDALDAQNNTQE